MPLVIDIVNRGDLTSRWVCTMAARFRYDGVLSTQLRTSLGPVTSVGRESSLPKRKHKPNLTELRPISQGGFEKERFRRGRNPMHIVYNHGQ